MNSINKKLLSLAVSIMLIVAIGCGNQKPSDKTAEDSGAHSDYSESAQSDSIFFLIPSPGEILERFQNAKFRYNAELLNSPGNKSNYITTRSKSLNLGIYITEMAYCAFFERTNEAIDYLDAIKELSSEVNISSNVFESLIDRSKKNIGQKDSIMNISNEVFYEMIHFLEVGGKTNAIALISSGAFIESMFLALESVDEFTAENGIISKIEEFRYPLENLLAQSTLSKDDPNVQSILVFLNDMNEIYQQIDTGQSEFIIKKNEAGEINLMGGSVSSLTEKDFNTLKTKVKEIRNNIIRN